MSHTLEAFRVSTPSNHHTEVGLCQCPAQVQWGWTRSGSSAKAHDTSGLGESPGGRRQTPARRCRRRRHSGRLCWRTPTPQRDSVSEPSATQACAQAKERERARGRSPTSCSQHTRRAPRQLTAVVITPRSTVSTFAAVPSDIPQATSRSDILIYDISSRFPAVSLYACRGPLESQAPRLRCHGQGWILTDLHSRRRRGAGRCVVGQGKGRP